MGTAGTDIHVFIPELMKLLQLHAHTSRASLSNSIIRKSLAVGAMVLGAWAGGDLGTRIFLPSVWLFTVNRDSASGVFVPPSPLLPGQVTDVSGSWLTRKRKPGSYVQLFWDKVGTGVS